MGRSPMGDFPARGWPVAETLHEAAALKSRENIWIEDFPSLRHMSVIAGANEKRA